MAEFCRADLAAALGVSVVAAGKLIGDALDLRHRLPRLWAAVQTGDVTVWMARKIAVRTRPLTLDAARKVDAVNGWVGGDAAVSPVGGGRGGGDPAGRPGPGDV